MSYIVVDVAADGPIPHKYSMVSFGAVVLEPGLSKTFCGKPHPISYSWHPEALIMLRLTRKEHEDFADPTSVMEDFAIWLRDNSVGSPVFVSANLASDWQWINYYFHYFTSQNPFGSSARRIEELYCGVNAESCLTRDWKRVARQTGPGRDPFSDVKAQAKTLLELTRVRL
jgi:hypothetical protein